MGGAAGKGCLLFPFVPFVQAKLLQTLLVRPFLLCSKLIKIQKKNKIKIQLKKDQIKEKQTKE